MMVMAEVLVGANHESSSALQPKLNQFLPFQTLVDSKSVKTSELNSQIVKIIFCFVCIDTVLHFVCV